MCTDCIDRVVLELTCYVKHTIRNLCNTVETIAQEVVPSTPMAVCEPFAKHDTHVSVIKMANLAIFDVRELLELHSA